SSRSLDPAGEDLIGDEGLALDVRGKVVLEASGKMKHRLRRRLASLAEQRGSAAPADLDPAKQVSLGARHPEHTRGIEAGVLAEDLRVRQETDLRPTPVRRLADRRQRRSRLS